MLEWDVIGANRTTGDTVTMRVLADDEEQAIRIVGGAVLVEKVLRAVPTAEPAAGGHAAESAPDYQGILVGAAVLRVIGVLAVVAGLLLVGFRLVNPPAGGAPSEVLSSVATALMAGLGWVVYGLLIIFVASLGTAVRDIARNSFRR